MDLLIIQIGSYLLWFPLQILAMAAVVRCGIRRYPLIILYLVATFLAAVAQMPAAWTSVVSHQRVQTEWYRRLHYSIDGVIYVLVLVLVISLVYRASARLGSRHLLRFGLILAGLLFIGISFAIHYDSKVAYVYWMKPWTRDMNFCAAVLDLALWMLLLVSREKDHRLLLLTGGIGIMFAGEAIAEAIKSMAMHFGRKWARDVFLGGHVFGILADAVFLYIWWQAFRKDDTPRPGLKAPVVTAARL